MLRSHGGGGSRQVSSLQRQLLGLALRGERDQVSTQDKRSTWVPRRKTLRIFWGQKVGHFH